MLCVRAHRDCPIKSCRNCFNQSIQQYSFTYWFLLNNDESLKISFFLFFFCCSHIILSSSFQAYSAGVLSSELKQIFVDISTQIKRSKPWVCFVLRITLFISWFHYFSKKKTASEYYFLYKIRFLNQRYVRTTQLRLENDQNK